MKKNAPLVGALASLLLMLFVSLQAGAQIPDTVYQKPTLPTGPPAPPQPTQQPPQQRPATRPAVIEPEVIQPEVVRQRAADEPETLLDHLYYGGSLGLQFGTYTNISLLPILGYRVTDRFSIGAGAVYHFIRSSGISLNNYGGRGFAQVELFDVGDGAILGHGELEALSTQALFYDPYNGYSKQRKTLSLPMVGLGYRQRISEKASFDILVLYNVNDDPWNPYSNPVIRAGINLPFRK